MTSLSRYILPIVMTGCSAFMFSSCAMQQGQPIGENTSSQPLDPSKRARLVDGKVIAPKNAPARVKRAIAAANSIVTKPYRLGGGHGRHHDSAYDCSGATAFVLKEAGMLQPNAYPVSGGFLRWGRPGYGDWITVYTKRGHVFLVIAGVRFDTSGSRRGIGPRWYTKSRRTAGFKVRHVPGI